MFRSKQNTIFHTSIKQWGYVQNPTLCQTGMGNANPQEYSASSQILMGI
jgi:hypothetical protein